MTVPSEQLERSALADLHAAASTDLSKSLCLSSVSMGSTLVSVAGALPDSAVVVNRALGVGLDEPETIRSVREVLSVYQRAGVERYFLQIHPDSRPSEMREWLLAAGLERARGWQKFRRGRDAVPPVSSDLRVAEVGAEYAEAFGRIVCDAFDLGDAAIPWLAELPGRQDWKVFMSFAGDDPAGAGALFVQDEYAWTDFGATAPKHRRRGSQAAVLAQRIEYALDAGCREIFTCTGEDVPGDPQHSYKNIRRLGFKETYVRENFAPRRS